MITPSSSRMSWLLKYTGMGFFAARFFKIAATMAASPFLPFTFDFSRRRYFR